MRPVSVEVYTTPMMWKCSRVLPAGSPGRPCMWTGCMRTGCLRLLLRRLCFSVVAGGVLGTAFGLPTRQQASLNVNIAQIHIEGACVSPPSQHYATATREPD